MNIADRKVTGTFGSEVMVARFKAKVVINPESGCHEWHGCRHSRGYGQLRFSGRLEYAHRLAWLLAGREIPTGLYVLHRCDNRRCVNLNHLFVGTQAVNLADMSAKKRARGQINSPQVNGEKLKPWRAEPFRHLRLEDVIEIRKSERSNTELANTYRVSRTTIVHIRRGATWKTTGGSNL